MVKNNKTPDLLSREQASWIQMGWDLRSGWWPSVTSVSCSVLVMPYGNALSFDQCVVTAADSKPELHGGSLHGPNPKTMWSEHELGAYSHTFIPGSNSPQSLRLNTPQSTDSFGSGSDFVNSDDCLVKRVIACKLHSLHFWQQTQLRDRRQQKLRYMTTCRPEWRSAFSWRSLIGFSTYNKLSWHEFGSTPAMWWDQWSACTHTH